MISYRTKRLHARSRINRIFSRVVFLERKLGVSVFSSLFIWGGTSPVRSDLEWQSQRKNHFEMGFPFVGGHLPSQKFIWFEDLLFSFLVSFIDRELFCFPPIFSFLLSSDLWSRILLFLSFSFFFFRSLIGNSGFSIRYSLSLEEILLSSSLGERMRILFMGQGSR